MEIKALPESIDKLKRVKKVWLYGSKIKRIPPEIGGMESLEQFDPYTSYDLHWLPYELTNCKKLKDSRISTRVLYGNYKNRMGFPSLKENPVKYFQEVVKCSVCKKSMSYEQTDQYWLSMGVGTDIVPLLANICSDDCKSSLPSAPEDYVQLPHKGGSELQQPLTEDEKWDLEEAKDEAEQSKQSQVSIELEKASPKIFKFLEPIYKLWEK